MEGKLYHRVRGLRRSSNGLGKESLDATDLGRVKSLLRHKSGRLVSRRRELLVVISSGKISKGDTLGLDAEGATGFVSGSCTQSKLEAGGGFVCS